MSCPLKMGRMEQVKKRRKGLGGDSAMKGLEGERPSK